MAGNGNSLFWVAIRIHGKFHKHGALVEAKNGEEAEEVIEKSLRALGSDASVLSSYPFDPEEAIPQHELDPVLAEA